jgi:hypothetical protein
MLGNSIVSQHFMEPECSIPNSQELSTCSYPEPDQSSPHHPPTSPRSILILSTHLRLGLPSCIFPSGFPTNNLYAFLYFSNNLTSDFRRSNELLRIYLLLFGLQRIIITITISVTVHRERKNRKSRRKFKCT